MAQIPLMSTRDAAERLRISIPTVTRLARSGALPVAAKAPGPRGAFMFDPTVVEHFAADREARP